MCYIYIVDPFPRLTFISVRYIFKCGPKLITKYTLHIFIERNSLRCQEKVNGRRTPRRDFASNRKVSYLKNRWQFILID